MLTIDEAKQISIKDYLESRGIEARQNGRKWFCSSPFSRDSNWSFAIYPNNTFYCWSTGRGGDVIRLVQLMEGFSFKEALEHLSKSSYSNYRRDYKKFKDNPDFWKDFDINRYINKNQDEIKAIISYGQNRSISSGYLCGVYFTRDTTGKSWIRNPSLMFPHQDLEGNVIGAKFRKIYDDHRCDGHNGPRFSMRGNSGLYILDTQISETWQKACVWLCESETSSNSLWEYFKSRGVPAIIICMGGVSSAPKDLPDKYKGRETKLIIDYDGNEELYNERLEHYQHLNVKPVKLILPKGEDINSLYNRKEMWKIENLLK